MTVNGPRDQSHTSPDLREAENSSGGIRCNQCEASLAEAIEITSRKVVATVVALLPAPTGEPAMATDCCCICLDGLDIPGLSCQKLDCGHVLHEHCINKLRQSGLPGLCPLCRQFQSDLAPVEVLFAEAVILQIRGQNEQAFQKFEKILEIDPCHALACGHKASHFDMGLGVRQNDLLAAEWYEKSMKFGHRPFNNLGQVYKRMGRVADAQAMFLKATQAGPGFSASAFFNLARSKQEMGELQQAEELYREGHRHGHLLSTYNLAQMMFRRGDTAQAEVLYRDVINRPQSIIPDCHEDKEFVLCAMNMLGHVLKQQGRNDEAVEMWVQGALKGSQEALANLSVSTRARLKEAGCKDADNLAMSLLKELVKGGSSPTSVATFLESLRSLEPRETDALVKGSYVILHGLETEVGRALNGRRGVVLGRDTASGRVAVQVDGAGRKLFKRVNLAWSPLPPQATPWQSPADYDVNAALRASSRHMEERAALFNAPLMEALLESRPPNFSLDVVVLECSRNEAWLRKALAVAPELEERRRQIEEAGHRVELECGAKFLVPAGAFKLVEEDLQRRGMVLCKRHIVVDVALEKVVEEVISTSCQALSRRERGSFKLKGKAKLQVTSPPLTALQDPSTQQGLPIKRTFIQIQIPSSLYSLSSVRPATT